MRVGKAKRRWIRWCRYIAATGSQTGSPWFVGYHRGLTNAYDKASRAHTWVPKGLRPVYYPKWASGVKDD